MREIRMSGSEGGGAKQLSLPLFSIVRCADSATSALNLGNCHKVTRKLLFVLCA